MTKMEQLSLAFNATTHALVALTLFHALSVAISEYFLLQLSGTVAALTGIMMMALMQSACPAM